jgi:hypothetical protein
LALSIVALIITVARLRLLIIFNEIVLFIILLFEMVMAYALAEHRFSAISIRLSDHLHLKAGPGKEFPATGISAVMMLATIWIIWGITRKLATWRERAYRKSIELDPKFQIAWTNRGRLLESRGRNLEAFFAYAQADALNPPIWRRTVQAAIFSIAFAVAWCVCNLV